MVLQRARQIHYQENLVLPLYSPLAARSEGTFTAPALSVLTALAVVAGDSLWEKLTFLTRLMDPDDNKVNIASIFAALL